MKTNVTLKLDADLLREARVVAAEEGRSISALLTDRLEAIAATTRSAKRGPRGASAMLIGPLFRVLAFMGIFNWFINRQRFVNAFVTNLRGPDTRMAFLDMPITDVIPIAVVTGNVPVSFAVLSYAGTLAVTVIADPLACPHLDTLTGSLKHQLDHPTPRHALGASPVRQQALRLRMPRGAPPWRHQ